MVDIVQSQAFAPTIQAPPARPRLRIVVSDPLPTCPKCGTERRDPRACHRCGLAGARMDSFRASRDASVPEALHAAWLRARDAWTTPAAHDALLQVTSQHQGYAWVAAQYREAARERPDDAIAEAQLLRLRRAAEATLAVSATARAQRAASPYRGLTAMLVVVVLGIVGSGVYAHVRPAFQAAPVASSPGTP